MTWRVRVEPDIGLDGHRLLIVRSPVDQHGAKEALCAYPDVGHTPRNRQPGAGGDPVRAPMTERTIRAGGQWDRTQLGLYVPPTQKRRYNRPIGIDLFAGAGGFSLGMHQAGVHVVAALEYDADAAITYMMNLARRGVRIHFDTTEREQAFSKKIAKAMGLKADKAGRILPDQDDQILHWRNAPLAGSGWISHYASCECPPGHHEGVGYDGQNNEYIAEINARPAHSDGCEHFWVADIRNVTGEEILDAIGLEPGDVDVVFGGPPCQGFSMANARRSPTDPRNTLVFQFVRLILEINPKAMVMENVPQIASMVTAEGVPVIDALARVLADGGWSGYDALRRGLTYQAGAAAAVRNDSNGPRNKHEQPIDSDDTDDRKQLGLFGEVTA